MAKHDPNWRTKTDARGYYDRDDAIVVDAKGFKLGATYASMRSAIVAAERIPGAMAVRVEE